MKISHFSMKGQGTLYLVPCVLLLLFFGIISVNASVSGTASFSAGFTNTFPITIPAGLTFSVSVSSQVTGSAAIKSPSGNTVANFGMTGGTTVLSEIGTYSVSENYHLEVTGTPSIGDPQTITDDKSAQWTFTNTAIGSIGTFSVSSYVNLSKGPHSDNLNVTVSSSSITATTNKPIPPGSSASAVVNINWGVNTSMGIEAPPEFGTIVVNTNLDSASFSVSGPKNYSGSGTSWSVSNAPLGTYSVTFNPVAGYYTPPPSEPKTLIKDGTISFSGNYEEIPKFGAIVVNTNLDEASFNISGPANFSGSGKSWMVENASVGTYTISFGAVDGYNKPPSATKTLSPGSSIAFSGTYEEIPKVGIIAVNTNLDAASFTITGPVTYSGSGKSWSTSYAPVGNYTISFSSVDGYETPPSQTKTLNTSETITFTGNYVEIPQIGTIVVNTNLDEASFSISGRANYDGSGKSWSVADAPVGTYSISFKPVKGYKTPSSETKTLTQNGKITFTGAYIEDPDLGTIIVNTNLDLASFNISGPANYTGSGRSWSVSNAPTGNYTISYNPIAGYQTPSSDSKTLNRDGTITFTGSYEEIVHVGNIVVNTNLDEASFSITGRAKYNGSGKSWTVTGVPVGDYTIIYNPVSGYWTPPSETKTLAKDGTITFTGKYNELSQTGSIAVNTNLDAASFSLTGPANYNGSGKSWSIAKAPVGDYTITYNNVAGYKTPAPETKYLAEGKTISFTGNYDEWTPVNIIVVETNLNMATFTVSGPNNYTGSGKYQTWVDVPLGTYTIIYKPVMDYRTPEQESKTLVNQGDIITFTGEYKPRGGNIVVNTNLDEAIYEVSGPGETLKGKGKHQEWTDVPLGSYTINYKPVDGYRTPAKDTRLLRSYEETITFTGTYSSLPPVITSVEVTGSPAKAGDKIIITLRGTAKNTAKFSIIGVVNNVNMTEDPSTPGLYRGEYVVVNGISIVNGVLSVSLSNGLGMTTTDESKRVTIDAIPPVIRSVEITGSPVRKPGDIIVVTLVGETGGMANFSINGIAQNIPMEEGLPGVYTGIYKAVEGLNIRSVKVIMQLKDAVGNISTDESNSVSIRTAPWDVNSDRVIDMLDIVAVALGIGKNPDNAPELDVNEDGVINIQDLVLVSLHYGEKYGEKGGILASSKPLSLDNITFGR